MYANDICGIIKIAHAHTQNKQKYNNKIASLQNNTIFPDSNISVISKVGGILCVLSRVFECDTLEK